MRLTRTVAALTFTLTLGLAAGCSGDDSDDPKADNTSASPSPTATGSKSNTPTPIPTMSGAKACDIDADITGAFEASWTGEAQVLKGEGRVTYAAQNDDVVLAAALFDKQTVASVTQGRSTYVTAMDDEGVSIDSNGASASIDADAIQGGTAKGIHLNVTIDC